MIYSITASFMKGLSTLFFRFSVCTYIHRIKNMFYEIVGTDAAETSCNWNIFKKMVFTENDF